MNSDYFAEGLLTKLEQTEPLAAAYEAQAVSRGVGFDFKNFSDVVPRAVDEIREAKEAFLEMGDGGREHFGDELADIMFSLVNLARHAGLKDLPALNSLLKTIKVSPEFNTNETLDLIGSAIENATTETAQDMYLSSMASVIALAVQHNFDPTKLLIDNVRKYLDRCMAIEKLAKQDGKNWSDLAANNEIILYWKRAKVLLQ